jgi:hypothetical protein
LPERSLEPDSWLVSLLGLGGTTREFIRLATDAITLEKLEKGILRLTIIWSPLMGFIWPEESSTRAYDTAIIQQRPLQVSWTHDYIHDGVSNDNY